MKSFALLLLTGFLAVFIQAQLGDTLTAHAAATPADPLAHFVGSAEEAFGDTLFIKADAYFHGGVVDRDHHDESAEDLQKEGVVSEDHDKAETAPRDWWEKINSRIQTHETIHLAKEKRREMLPFFAMATAMDPHNVEAVLTTAHWLDTEFGKTEDALSLLQKGIRDNPDSWEIENALGRIAFRRKEFKAATQHFEKALQKAGGAPLEKYQHVDLSYHLAEAMLALGDRERALASYQDAARFFDSKTAPYLQGAIQERIKELSAAG